MHRPLALGLLGLALVASTACGRIAFDELAPDDGAGGALAITPAVARTNLNSRVAFAAHGGAPPYTFALASGPGAFDATTAELRAPGYPGAATVEVRDAAGAIASAEVSFGGEALYAVGSFVNDVAGDGVLRSADGMTWERIGSLPAARGAGALVVFEDALVYAGGALAAEGTRADEVWRSADGITWTELGRLPSPSYASGVTVFDGRLWLIGGRILGNNYSRVVWSSADGASWQSEPPLVVGIHGAMVAVFEGALWMIGGHESSDVTDGIWTRRPDGSWLDAGSVPVPGEYHGVTVHAGELWVAGGVGLRDRVVSSADGVTWTDRSRLPIARDFSTLLEWDGALWVVAGLPAQTWRAAGGSAWSIVGSFPANDDGTTIVQFTPRS